MERTSPIDSVLTRDHAWRLQQEGPPLIEEYSHNGARHARRISEIPAELVWAILSWLDQPVDIVHARLTCKQWNQIDVGERKGWSAMSRMLTSKPRYLGSLEGLGSGLIYFANRVSIIGGRSDLWKREIQRDQCETLFKAMGTTIGSAPVPRLRPAPDLSEPFQFVIKKAASAPFGQKARLLAIGTHSGKVEHTVDVSQLQGWNERNKRYDWGATYWAKASKIVFWNAKGYVYCADAKRSASHVSTIIKSEPISARGDPWQPRSHGALIDHKLYLPERTRGGARISVYDLKVKRCLGEFCQGTGVSFQGETLFVAQEEEIVVFKRIGAKLKRCGYTLAIPKLHVGSWDTLTISGPYLTLSSSLSYCHAIVDSRSGRLIARSWGYQPPLIQGDWAIYAHQVSTQAVRNGQVFVAGNSSIDDFDPGFDVYGDHTPDDLAALAGNLHDKLYVCHLPSGKVFDFPRTSFIEAVPKKGRGLDNLYIENIIFTPARVVVSLDVSDLAVTLQSLEVSHAPHLVIWEDPRLAPAPKHSAPAETRCVVS